MRHAYQLVVHNSDTGRSCWSDMDKRPATPIHHSSSSHTSHKSLQLPYLILLTERIITPRSIQVFPKKGLKNQRHQFSQSFEDPKKKTADLKTCSSRSSLLLSNNLSHCNFATSKVDYNIQRNPRLQQQYSQDDDTCYQENLLDSQGHKD